MKPSEKAIGRPWLSSYPADVPADLTVADERVPALFRAVAGAMPEREAIRYFDVSLTFAELDRLSDAFAAWMVDKGVAAGARVGIILQNVPHFAIAVLAAWKVGAIPVPGNPMYRADELRKLFADYQPVIVVAHGDQADAVVDALGGPDGIAATLVTVRAHDFRTRDDDRLLPPDVGAGTNDLLSLCREHAGRTVAPVRVDAASPSFLLYTSGTTGMPKGAVISHAALAFNVQAAAAWMRIGAESRIQGLAPLFHVTGFVLHLGLVFATGCSLALHYRFEAAAVLDLMREYRPTFTIAAITAFNALLNAPGVSAADFASLETTFSGGAPISPALREALAARLGIEVHPVYGMTETCSPTHVAPPGLPVPVHRQTGALAVGLPISSTFAKIAAEDGTPLPAGQPGEIWMRGPQLMTEYWNKPEETARTLVDGWLRTGDVGVMDDAGWFYVVDRQKDMIVASGFKVWPREVEDVLLQHEAIREAAVIGVPDAYRGETVHAFVSLKPDGLCVDDGSLTAFCRERLAAYKVPRRITVVAELPKTATGKIQRAVLREANPAGGAA